MKDNVEWLLHIDTDELMYPGGNDGFSLQHVLASFAEDVDTVVFPNYESLPETDKVHDPFTEVQQLAFAGWHVLMQYGILHSVYHSIHTAHAHALSHCNPCCWPSLYIRRHAVRGANFSVACAAYLAGPLVCLWSCASMCSAKSR